MKSPTTRRDGSVLLLLFIVTTVLFITSMAIGTWFRQQAQQTTKYGEDLAAFYAAQAGIDRVLWRMRNLFEEPLVRFEGSDPKEPGTVNEPLLDLYHFDRARDWARTFVFGEAELMDDAGCTVHAELVNVTKNPFYSFIDRVEPRVPESLEQFRERKDKKDEDEDIEGSEALGGWTGELRLTSTGDFRGTRRVIEVVRQVKIVDVSPPAPDHTLFIQSKQPEKIEEGRFLLSNLDLPAPVAELLHQLTMKANDMLRLTLSEDQRDVLANVDKIQDFLTNQQEKDEIAEALRMVFDLATHVKDEQIKDKVDSIILSLNPRNWGRVRTNGSLYVKLPFFAADDIINYFADNTIFGHQRPEVGYLFHDNRLHDPYLGVYTHFEGLIYKQYRRLNPLSMGPSTEPTPVAPQRYTINTQFNYVDRHPDRRQPAHLDRIKRHAKDLAHSRFKGAKVAFKGTAEEPIRLDGIWYVDQKVEIGGPFSGRGLIVANSDITLTGSLLPVHPGDRVSLVSLNGMFRLLGTVRTFEVEAGMYARNGIRGLKNQTLNVKGNLVVDRLNRKNMPKYFTCRFDPNLKNHMVDNVVGVISRQFLSYKERGASAVWEPARRTAVVKPWTETSPTAAPSGQDGARGGEKEEEEG